MKETKVLFITNIISPYRIPLWNYLHQVADFDFKVVALAEKEANREWRVAKEQIKFDYQILPGFHRFIRSRELPLHLNRGLWRALRQYKPDIIITSGYDAPAYWQALLYCKFFKKNYILWNGTTLLSVGTTGGLVGRMKRVIIKGADRYIAYGTKAAEYLVHMGAPEGHIYVGVNTVDMDWFREQTKKLAQSKILQEERAAYPKLLLLYVGQLVKRKGLFQVLKALGELNDPEIGLLIVGSGPQEKELRCFCQEQELKNVYFEGFHQQDGLPKYYALSDVLLMPSFEEVWGLVVNEALAGGLYVLCSDRAGAAYDLIEEGWNGALFDPHNVGKLALLIRETKEQLGKIRARREAISEHACREFGIERSAKVFLEAVGSFG